VGREKKFSTFLFVSPSPANVLYYYVLFRYIKLENFSNIER